jgi:NADPH2:quinone reductase
MRAIRMHQFGGPEVLKLEELPDPRPTAGQVVVSTMAIGVNPVETYIRSGKYGPKPFPYTPGTDAAGVVESVGAGVTTATTGQRVYVYGTIDGAYTTKILATAEQVFPLPDRFTFDQGAAIGVPFGTAFRALFIRGNAKPNETILIHGASGGVGTAAVQLAINHGCKVIGTAGTPAGMELVKQLGAHQVFNHRSGNYIQQIMDSTSGHGIDLIIEFAADKNLDKDLGLLAMRGRVIVVGNRGRIEIDPRQTMARDSDIRGMSIMHADASELAMIHAALRAGFNNGTLNPIVRTHFPLSEAGIAHDAVMEAGALGKIVLHPS